MEIRESAFRHGVSREDIEHAVRNALTSGEEMPEGVVMLIGPARDGRILEVGLNRHSAVIHAMTARPKFLRRSR